MPQQAQTKAQTNKFEHYSIYELLDKRASAAKAKKLMNDFCGRWRAERGAKNGGITANTVQLLWALLKILPVSMEAIRTEQPELFAECMELGEFCLFTNKTILARKMLEEDGNTFATMEACKKTIYNQLERLQDSDLNIITYKMRYNVKGEPSQTGNGQFLLYINPEILVFYPTKEEVLAVHAEAKTDQNAPTPPQEIKNVLHSNYINSELLKTLDNRPSNVDKVSTSVDDSKLSNFEVRSTTGKSDFGTVASGQAPNLWNVQGILDNYSPEKSDQAAKNLKNHARKINRDKIELAGVLWSQAYENLYKGELFTSEMVALSQDLLENHLEGVQKYVQDIRTALMQEWIQSHHYQNLPNDEKIRLKARKWKHRRLPNVERKAFEIVSRAIQIQKENIAKKGYKIYSPKVYFSMDYGFHKAIFFAKKEYKNLLRYNAKDEQLVTHNRMKSDLYSYSSGIAFILQRDGYASAKKAYEKHFYAFRDTLNAAPLNNEQRKIYINRFKDQIKHLFTQTKAK